MKSIKLLSAALVAGLGLASLMTASDVLAQKKNPKDTAPAVASDPPMTKKPIALTLPGLAWGMSTKQVADLVDKVFDADYRPLYKEVQPGVKMKELDAQIAEDKAQFRRSRIDFGKLPTGVDATPLKGEYTYLNAECMMTLARKGEATAYFFIQDKLWKTIEEHKLNDGSPFGKTYTEAVVKLSTVYGVPGRVVPADATHMTTEVDWKDAGSHMRAIQRSDTRLALGLEDLVTLNNLSTLRTNKPAADDGIDPAVAAAMHKPDDGPGPPPDKKNPKKPSK